MKVIATANGHVAVSEDGHMEITWAKRTEADAPESEDQRRAEAFAQRIADEAGEAEAADLIRRGLLDE